MKKDLQTVARILHERQDFVLTTHVNPDGDGIGSELALSEWLINAGKQATVMNHSTTPRVYRFLDPSGRILTFDQQRDAPRIKNAEVVLVLDTNQTDRLRSMEHAVVASNALKICIDHHLEPPSFADHSLVDDHATSTGEIIYRLLLELDGNAITARIAEALYCAIMTDTGSFRYPSVDPEIHLIVARLIECGANPVTIYANVYERWSTGRIHLLGEMLAGLKTEQGGKIAHVTITQEMLRRTNTLEEDTDNFTTYPMSVDGVVAGILFLELAQGLKISFRSRGDIPINELAKEFGGNGHKNAAGARIDDGTLGSTKERVLNAARKYITT